MEPNAAADAARALLDQHVARADLAPVAPAPATVADAYRVQDAYLGLATAHWGHGIAGWKVALTSPVMQSFVGIDHPCAGAILAHRVHASPATLAASDFVHVGVETEIAVRIGSDAGPTEVPYDAESIAGHVAACMAATEIVDDRNCVYDALDAPLLVADNAFNFGCVLGPERTDWQDLDLAAAPGRMRINGEVAGSGVGGDALGHPLAALAWLANHLLGRDRHLEAGDVVMTGSIVATKWLAAGDLMISEVDGLGEARLAVQ